MTNVHLATKGVSVWYEKHQALVDMTFALDRGKWLGVLGPNGCGKSTLLRTVSRALSPASGVVEFAGKPLDSWSPRELARRMAVVPQSDTLGLDFTAGEIVSMGRSPHQGRWGIETARDREVVHESMVLTDTTEFQNRLASTLSGGEYQRVLIARALAQEPELLLLDEPTSHLDLAAQSHILELLSRLNRERGLTLIAVLHDLTLASLYCGDLLLMSKGSLVAQGSPEETLTVDRIRAVYGAEVAVIPHPASTRPMVVPLPPRH